jgi:hypothetical protein
MPISGNAPSICTACSERPEATQGVALHGTRDIVRILNAILAWDKELETVTAEVEKKLAAKGSRLVAGSREWDLRRGEELERALMTRISQGE